MANASANVNLPDHVPVRTNPIRNAPIRINKPCRICKRCFFRSYVVKSDERRSIHLSSDETEYVYSSYHVNGFILCPAYDEMQRRKHDRTRGNIAGHRKPGVCLPKVVGQWI